MIYFAMMSWGQDGEIWTGYGWVAYALLNKYIKRVVI